MANKSSAYQSLDNPPSPLDRSTPVRADNNIPLVCHICPKNSRFSDVSHLLTHISSKGHLSNHFQLRLSRDEDEAAETSLSQFEEWYEQNGIGALLLSRKNAREVRGNLQRQNQSTLSNRGGSGTAASRGTRGGRGSRGGRSGRGGRSSRRGRGNSVSVFDIPIL